MSRFLDDFLLHAPIPSEDSDPEEEESEEKNSEEDSEEVLKKILRKKIRNQKKIRILKISIVSWITKSGTTPRGVSAGADGKCVGDNKQTLSARIAAEFGHSLSDLRRILRACPSYLF